MSSPPQCRWTEARGLCGWRTFIEKHRSTQAMLPALEAILGHRSAHSLATGPVMAEPAEQTQRCYCRRNSNGQDASVSHPWLRSVSHRASLPSHPQWWSQYSLQRQLTEPLNRRGKCFWKGHLSAAFKVTPHVSQMFTDEQVLVVYQRILSWRCCCLNEWIKK